MNLVQAETSGSVRSLPRLVVAAFAPPELAFLRAFSERVATEIEILAWDDICQKVSSGEDKAGFITVLWVGHGGILPAQIAALRASGFGGPILSIFDHQSASEDLISSFFDAGSDEVLRLPLHHAILGARLKAMWLRYRAHTELVQAHQQMKDILSFIRHDLATPLSTLQMSLVGLSRLDRNSDKFDKALARCERSVTKMVETLRSCQTRFRPLSRNAEAQGQPNAATS